MKTFAVVLSAGSSTRFGGDVKKQFFIIKGRPLLYYSLSTFDKSHLIDEIIVVTSKEDITKVKKIVSTYHLQKVSKIIVGGYSRQESVSNALKEIHEEGFVLIHDAARPLVDEEIVFDLIKALESADGAAPAIKEVDTIVKVKENQLVSFEDREELYHIQTPQAFRLDVIKKAHGNSANKEASDDTQLVKQIGGTVVITKGKEKLRKVTTLEDTHAIEAYIDKNEQL